MSTSDADDIQSLIDTSLPRIGVHCRTIVLEPRVYLFDKPVEVKKQVRIIGDNTKIKLAPGVRAAFWIKEYGGESRFESLAVEGSDTSTMWPGSKEVGFDVQGGRIIVDQCTFTYFEVGVFLNSPPPVSAGDPTPPNADGSTIRSCEFSACIYGVRASGIDSSTCTIMDNRFTDCRHGVLDEAAGNFYQSNYYINCPTPGDPLAADGIGIRATGGATYSTFVAEWMEKGTDAEIGRTCLVVGGHLPTNARGDCDRVGPGWSTLTFRTRAKDGSAPDSVPSEALRLGGTGNFDPTHPVPVIGYMWQTPPATGPNPLSYRFLFFDNAKSEWQVA